MQKMIAKNGLPLKIKAEWTNDTYHYRTYKNSDDLQAETVEGWLVRINGVKFPRPQWNNDVDGDFFDYSYRYTPQEGRTEYGKQVAINDSIKDYNKENRL
tara:strand:- start:447 stop:746 length:300 start_codon:yes stop_codon:yes gene_type:complete